MVRQLPQLLSQKFEYVNQRRRGLRTPEFEERTLRRFHQVDPKPFGRDCDLDLVLKFVQRIEVMDRSQQVGLQLLQILLFDRRDDNVRALFARTDEFGSRSGVLEVAANRVSDFLARVHQPENDEQRHHGRNEVGVGYLPGSTVVPVMGGLLLDDDNFAGFSHNLSSFLMRYAAA